MSERVMGWGDFEVTAVHAAVADALAVRAQAGDRTAGDALWRALAVKIERFTRGVWRVRRRWLRVCGPDDLGQMAYLVLWDLLDAWPRRGGVLPYLLRLLPLWLRRAVDRAERGMSGGRVDLGADDAEEPAVSGWEITSLERCWLETVAGRLDGRARLVLLLLAEGLPVVDVARRLGVTRRTVRRDCLAMAEYLRSCLDGAAAGGTEGAETRQLCEQAPHLLTR